MKGKWVCNLLGKILLKKAEVHKDDLKERSDAEIQRSGQPLCIHELYNGEGARPFLHEENMLYRGLSLVSGFPSDLVLDEHLLKSTSCVEYGFVGEFNLSVTILQCTQLRVRACWLIFPPMC